jgi:filamentous hemagglutinin
VSEFDWTTTQRLTLLSIPVAEVGGTLLIKGGKAAVQGATKLGDEALTTLGQEGLKKNAGTIGSDGLPVLDLNKLAKQTGGKTDIKEATGEFFGNVTAQQLMPNGKYLGGSTGTGQTGLDGVYGVKSPDVDFVFIENKYNTSKQGTPKDGLQGSENWILGSGRLENAVGNRAAADIEAAVRSGRTETWLVRTLPDGRVQIKVLDSAGNPKLVSQSKILPPSVPTKGAQP